MTDDYLSDEDKALFRQVMRTVKPLDKTEKVTFKTMPPPEKIRRNMPAEKPVSDYNLSDYYANEVNGEAILSYCQQGIPSTRFRQLKTGQIPWQARLDLHGLRPESACDALCEFIERQYLKEYRCLLIIHGKGGKHGQAPVLKNRVNQWLQQLPQVMAFHSALARDGGSGALYVLLKRQRETK